MSEATSPVMEAAVPASKGLVARIVGVFFSPGETFEDIRRKPTILAPMALVAVLFGLVFYFIAPAQFSDQLAFAEQSSRFQSLGAEQQQRQIALFEEPPAWLLGTTATVYAIGLVGVTALFALLYWGIGNLLGGEPTYKATLSMLLFICFVHPVTHLLIKLPFILSKGSVLEVTFGPAMFAPGLEKTSSLYLSLASFDLFAIWAVVLTGIGVARVGKLSTGVGMGIAVVFFALGAALQLFFAGLGR